LLLIVLFAERFEFGIAEGGRFCERSRCRDVPELAGEFSVRPFTPAFALAFPLAPELLTWPFALAVPFTGEFPNRPAVVAFPFMVCTGECEAPGAGAVRATTARF
jgi:hypothetical protein